MKESRLIFALLLAVGIGFASVAVRAGEEKNTDAHSGAQHETEGSHAQKGAKKGEQEIAQKGGTVSGSAAAPQPGGHDADDEEEEEGSH